MPFEDNLLQMLRMQNIFGPQAAPAPVNTPAPAMPMQPAMNELYQPETRATDQMYKLLESIPQRNKPGKLRKIAAGMAGIAGGPEASNDFLYRPYHEQMQDFQMRFKPTMDVAQQERLQNVNMRQLADSIINRNIQQQRADLYQQSIENQTKNAETNRIRAESYARLNEFKMNPANFDMEIEAPKGGNYTLIDPKGIKPPIDTGIPTGTLDRMQEINLQVKGQMQVAAVRGAQTRQTEEVRQANRKELITQRATERQKKHTEAKTLSTSADAAAYKLAIKQHLMDNPSNNIFFDPSTQLPTDDAADDDTGTYERALDEIRTRYNRIKGKAIGTESTSVKPGDTGPPMRKEIPGMPGKFAISRDGGKTWVAE